MDLQDYRIFNATLLFFAFLFYGISFLVPDNYILSFRAAGVVINICQVLLILVRIKQ